MPKLKSNRGAAKRFKVTKKGTRIKHRAAFRSHQLTCKSSKRRRHLQGSIYVRKCDSLEVERLLNGS